MLLQASKTLWMGEKESEWDLVVSKFTCDDVNKIRNQLFIVTFVKGVYDDDHRKS